VERIDLSIPGPCILRPKVFADHRGFLMETYNKFRMRAQRTNHFLDTPQVGTPPEDFANSADRPSRLIDYIA
jgi:dTDP-4-dehydrorhamnose 3,5-epimerase-like enzyme